MGIRIQCTKPLRFLGGILYGSKSISFNFLGWHLILKGLFCDVRLCGLPCWHSDSTVARKKLGHAQLLLKSMVSEVEF